MTDMNNQSNPILNQKNMARAHGFSAWLNTIENAESMGIDILRLTRSAAGKHFKALRNNTNLNVLQIAKQYAIMSALDECIAARLHPEHYQLDMVEFIQRLDKLIEELFNELNEDESRFLL